MDAGSQTRSCWPEPTARCRHLWTRTRVSTEAPRVGAQCSGQHMQVTTYVMCNSGAAVAAGRGGRSGGGHAAARAGRAGGAPHPADHARLPARDQQLRAAAEGYLPPLLVFDVFHITKSK